MLILGVRLPSFAAWWLWWAFYLANVLTLEKKLRVMADWTVDLFLRRNVTRVRASAKTGNL